MEEVWKDIKDFEGLYQISNLGRVRSIKNKNRLLKPYIIHNGYCVISLCKDGIKFRKKIHRLVAESFIKNNLNKPQVNHKNGIKTDNFAGNLEWTTASENVRHCFSVLGHKAGYWNKGRNGRKSKLSKMVLQIKDDVVIAKFYGCCEAERYTGVGHSHISACANGKRNTAGGYKWRYFNEND